MVFFSISSIVKSIINSFNNNDCNSSITNNYTLLVSLKQTFKTTSLNNKKLQFQRVKLTSTLPKHIIKSNISLAIIIYLFLTFTTINLSYSQDAIVNDYLTMVARGKVQEVKAKLPDLMVEYPDSPGIKLLLAVVLEDAKKSIDIYNDIVKKYPDNIWADDAYWRLIQYYAIIGDINKAKSELALFRENYPTSPFLVTSGETVRLAESVINSRDAKNITKINTSVNTINSDNSSEITEIKVTKEPKVTESINSISKETNNHSEEKHSTLKAETTEKKLTNKLEKSKSSLPTLEELSNNADVKEKAEHNEEHSEEKETEENLELKEDSKSHTEENSHKTIEHSESTKHSEDSKITEKNSKNKNEEMSLEDEIKMRQNISKSLANKKLETETKSESNTNKNILKEEESTNSLMKTEEEIKSKTYGLQVAIYNSKEAAELEMQKYIKQRMRTEVKTKSVDGNKLYAVVIGNYSSKESAEGARTIVEKQCNCEPMIFEK